MGKAKFYYNSETCRYEPVRISGGRVLGRLSIFLGLAFLLATGLTHGYYSIYLRYKEENRLEKENRALVLYYELLKKDIVSLEQNLGDLQQRDDEIYRVIFEAEPISASVRQAGTGGAERYRDVTEQGLMAEELITETLEKVDAIKKAMRIQQTSYDALLRMAENKNEMYAAIPAIQPVSNKQLHRLSSGYGQRIDPIYKIKKLHPGIDFSAPRGTPIYATGAGAIQKVRTSRGGYGNVVIVDHGYGYETLYAHLSRFNVKVGDKVKRGDCIGYIGNTGKSTAPHLHYEVHYNKKKLNPIHFFFQDINQDEYEELLRRASIENQSLE